MPQWTCPKCKRQFAKKNQMHSCVIYPVKKHLAGKSRLTKNLYQTLKKKIQKEIGPIKVESLPCCIHFVSSYTFMCVYALKSKIRIHFASDRNIKSSRIDKAAPVAKTKWMFSLDVDNKKGLDKELMSWLKQAYYLKDGK
jgi:hypothetical protein